MRNTVDSRSQQVQQQRIDTKVQKQTANANAEEAKAKTPELNRPATTQYLNIVANERDDLGDNLSRSYNKLNQALTQTAAAPNEQSVDEQSEKMASYSKLAAKVIDRDPHLQEQVAQDLSTGKKLVRSRNASDTLQDAMSNLPRPLKEGTNSGKQLAKFIVENLVTLTDTKNMGAGLERDLAVRQISVPKQQPNLRTQQAASKVLAASIAYVQSNQPDVLKTLESDEPEAVKPGSTTAQVMTRYLRQALNEFPDESTYLDIFKQNRSHQKSEGYADKMSEEIAQRIHNLISKAATTAKSGNLIQLSPEEAARFDQIQRQAAGQGLQSPTTLHQANANALSALTGQNFPNATNTSNNQGASQPNNQGSPLVAEQDADNLRSKDTAPAPNNDVKSADTSKPKSGNVRDLSLSELSARAAKLQQQFRQERYRLANDGKDPEPSTTPTKTFDNVKTARDILKGTLSPENFALTERQHNIKDQIATQNNNLHTSLVANKAHAGITDNKVESKPTSAQTQAKEQVQNQNQAPKVAQTQTQPESKAQGSFAQGTTKAPVSAFQMEFSAIQNTVYGDIDIMPGMTIPVSHFGELSQSTLKPNQQALESLKVQARILEESLRQQSQGTITQQEPSKSIATTTTNEPDLGVDELTKAVADNKEQDKLALKHVAPQGEAKSNANTNVSTASSGKADPNVPLQLQQFLQQTANTLQNSQGGQLTLDASQLHSFLQQAQTLLKQVAPDLEVNLPSLSQEPKIVTQQNLDKVAQPSLDKTTSSEASDKTSAKESVSSQAKPTAPVETKEGETVTKQSTSDATTQTQAKGEQASRQTNTLVADNKQVATTVSKDNATSKAQTAESNATQNKAVATTKEGPVAKEGLVAKEGPVSSAAKDGITAQTKSEDTAKPPVSSADTLGKILDQNKLSLTLDKTQQNLAQQIKAKGGQASPEQVKLGESLAQARSALESGTTPRRLTELLLQVQNALTNQTKAQGNLQTPAQANLQKVLNQDLPKLQAHLQGEAGKAATTQGQTNSQATSPTTSQATSQNAQNASQIVNQVTSQTGQTDQTVSTATKMPTAPSPVFSDKGEVVTKGKAEANAQTKGPVTATSTKEVLSGIATSHTTSDEGEVKNTPKVVQGGEKATQTVDSAEQAAKIQATPNSAEKEISPPKETAATQASNSTGANSAAVPVLGSLFESLARTQEALKVLQQAPTLPEKQAAFDKIQKYLTDAHSRLTTEELAFLPSHKTLQQLVGFSELSVINIARANTPELTMQAMQQLNLCLTHAQREVLVQLQAMGALANATPEQNVASQQAQATQASQANQSTQAPQGTPAGVINQPQTGQTAQAGQTGQSTPAPAQGAIQVAQQAVQINADSTEEAELAAKFNQFKTQGATEGDTAIQNRTANAHIMRAPNLATAIHTNYSDTPDTITDELLVKTAPAEANKPAQGTIQVAQQAAQSTQVAQGAQASQGTPADITNQGQIPAQGATQVAQQATQAATNAQVSSVVSNLTKELNSNEMAWLSNAAKAAGVTPEEYVNSLVQAQIQAEQMKAANNNQADADAENNEVLNYRYSNVLYRMQEQGSPEDTDAIQGNKTANAAAKAPELNQSIVSLGKDESTSAEGVAEEDSVFSTRTSLAAAKERLEATQDEAQKAEQQKVRHTENREVKEQIIEGHQARQAEVAQNIRQDIEQKQVQDEQRQEQVKAEVALAQQQQQQAQQASALGGTKLGINADPDLVDQQFARLYQQQRAEQQQYNQQQQANIAQQIRAGGSSITMAHSDVVAQNAINDDLHQLQQNQSLGIQGNTGASRAAAEAQAQALAQGTQTIGRTAMMVDDGLDPAIRSNATVGNTNVEARTATAGGTPIQAQPNALGTSANAPNTGNVASQGQGATMAVPQHMQANLGKGAQGATPMQGMTTQGQATAQGQVATSMPQGNQGMPNATGTTLGQAVSGQGLSSGAITPQGGVAPVNGPNLVPTGDGRSALSVASLNQSMPFGATIPNSSTQLTIHLDDFNMHDPVVQNIGSTIPSKDAEGLNTQALTGVVADTDLNPQEEFSSVLQQNLVTEGVKGGVAGAAAITSGQNAPIPEESVVADVNTPRESGLLHRLASLFTGKTHDDLGEEISPKSEQNLSANSPELMKAIQEQSMQNQLKQASLDSLMYRLQTSVTDQNLPQHVREQAHKLMQALENPVADLHTVSSWLNFVTGPMSPSSSQALAMHQWAFLLLCIRFEQIGKNVEKFLKKSMSSDELNDLAPKLNEAHHESGLFNDLVDEPEEKAQELLNETFSQVSRLQQQVDVLPEGQLLPRYIPLPPFYRGGKEGSLQAQQHTDEDGGKSWHLNFNLDLEKLGQLQVKVKLRFPDIQMSFVTSNLETLQAVQTHMPELNARLKEIGLTSKGSSARLGRLQPMHSSVEPRTRNTYHGNEFNTDA